MVIRKLRWLKAPEASGSVCRTRSRRHQADRDRRRAGFHRTEQGKERRVGGIAAGTVRTSMGAVMPVGRKVPAGAEEHFDVGVEVRQSQLAAAL